MIYISDGVHFYTCTHTYPRTLTHMHTPLLCYSCSVTLNINQSHVHPNTVNLETEPKVDRFTKWRNIIGFWILGLCNNFPYVIMLSAAFDIIQQLENGGGGSSPNSTNRSNQTIGSCDLQFNETTNMSYYIGREKCAIQGTSVRLSILLLPTCVY